VLGDQSPLATDLLRLAAFFAPDDIPRPALVRGQSSLPSGLGEAAGDADQLADLVARPRAFSLVSTSGDGFSMHRLVQAVLRDGLERSEVERWAGTAVLLLDQVLPKQVSDVRLWSRTGRLVGHALTAAGHGVEQLVEPAATIRLLDRGATYLSATGGAPEDVAAMRLDALRLGEALPDGPPAWLLNNHGTWLVEQGALDEAQGMLERAVRATRRAEGGNSAELGTHWVNLGGLAQRRGELERARTYLQRGLAILDTLPEWADAQRATGHSLLGQVLFQEGDWDAAASHFAEAVRGYDAALGPTSQDSLLARTFLAQALGEDPRRVVTSGIMTASSIAAEEGRLLTAEPAWLDEAERLLRDAWESGEPGAAVELASLLRSQPGREAEGAAILAEAAERGDSEALYWHARDLAGEIGAGAESEIRRSIKAGNVFSWYDLGLVLASDENRRPEAEAAFRAALDGKFEIARNDLGILLLSWPGRESEGEAMLEEAGRRGHPRSWFNLGQYRWKTPGREHEAEGPLRRAAHAGYLRAYGSLAYLLEELNRLDESLAAFTEGLEAGEDALGPHLAEFLDRHPELEADSN
jgi:tetratricopeptide (TPR) repeat protein